MLGKLLVPGQPIALAVGAGGVVCTFFSHFFLPLWVGWLVVLGLTAL